MATEYIQLFPESHISYSIPIGPKDTMIEALLELAISKLDLAEKSREALRLAVTLREKQGSTGVGGLAIPHVKSPLVERTVAALGVFPAGIEFEAVDDEPVYSVFLLISPESRADEHLSALRWVAGIGRKADFTRFIRQTRSPKEARSLLEEMAG